MIVFQLDGRRRSLTCRVSGVHQVRQASVVAHVVVAALQRQSPAERLGGPLAAAADVGGVQAPVGERGVWVERVQDLGEAGVQLRFTHVPSGHAVWSVAVTPDLSWRRIKKKNDKEN